MSYSFFISIPMVCYVIVVFLLRKNLHQQHKIPMISIKIFSILAVLSHASLVSLQIFTPSGQDLSLINMILLVNLMITLSVSVMSIKITAPFLLIVVYGFAAFVQFISLFLPKSVMIAHFFTDPSLAGHITLSLLAYCVIIIATLHGIQFQFINDKLKRKDIVASHFPPLLQVEKQQFQLLGIGTLLLSAALLTGFVYLDDMFEQSIAHKTILSIIAWGIFVCVLTWHHYHGFRGRSAVVITVCGTFILTLAYFGSRFVKEIIIGKG